MADASRKMFCAKPLPGWNAVPGGKNLPGPNIMAETEERQRRKGARFPGRPFPLRKSR
ncbi:hypothetical protein FHS61_000185 [Altererythrobacter atlanticus]|uniref:Uncharacterized protein n=1 Tax=Croceibacterium atlanticum TaxID=1267766 RepID=A0A0F7KUG6_9SPHN|nr:hypothetical protein WYH_01374 [Croceibacterium atlanticum]MBB5731192.1 hypothetical protein [Croceibacterium atlanticum]